MHSTVEKLILGWLVVVATAWACDSPLVHRTDGGSDILTPDVPDAADVSDRSDDMDVIDAGADADADADTEWWGPDPDERRIPCPGAGGGWLGGMTAVYPYIIWAEGYWVDNGHTSRILALNVETNTVVQWGEIRKRVSGQKLVYHEPSQSVYFLGDESEEIPDWPFYRTIVFLYKLIPASQSMEEIQLEHDLYSPGCAAYGKSKTTLHRIDPISGWLLLSCQYILESNSSWIIKDVYRKNIFSGEVQPLVEGFRETPIVYSFLADVSLQHFTLNINGVDERGQNEPPYVFSSWDVSGEVAEETFRLEVPYQQMAFGLYGSEESLLYYSELGSSGRLEGRIMDQVTGLVTPFPAFSRHVYLPARLHESQSPVVSWMRAEGDINYWSDGSLTPANYSVGIYLWDPDNGRIRKVTGEPYAYGFPMLMHDQPEPRYMVYLMRISQNDLCIAYKDMIAAGILDETGHLLPEP
ncbi:hypothetical protein KJ975_05435 [Myxococcota bacterium]|nr:hypothetical protein [Myxococcota bacterium]